MLEALRDGGPRKREGGGRRCGCAEDGFRVDMAVTEAKMLRDLRDKKVP